MFDTSGEVLASALMHGAIFLSLKTETAKARTAASINAPTGKVGNNQAVPASITMGGALTVLCGGPPVRFGGMHEGAIGIGSGTGEQDIDVMMTAFRTVRADAV